MVMRAMFTGCCILALVSDMNGQFDVTKSHLDTMRPLSHERSVMLAELRRCLQGDWVVDDGSGRLRIEGDNWIELDAGPADTLVMVLTDSLPAELASTLGRFFWLQDRVFAGEGLPYEVLGCMDEVLSIMYLMNGKRHLFRRRSR